MSFLHSLFGPSKAEIWRQLSQEIGATYVPDSFWNGAMVVARHGQWIITLDTQTISTGRSTIIYTRLRAPYVNRDGLRFTIYRKGLFSDLGKWLGMQDIVLGDPTFDEGFIIQGTDEQKVQQLLANAHLRELVKGQPSFHLTVKDDEGWFSTAFPEGVDELCFQVVGLIRDIDRLKALYKIFAAMLDGLCRIGSAYEDEPEVSP